MNFATSPLLSKNNMHIKKLIFLIVPPLAFSLLYLFSAGQKVSSPNNKLSKQTIPTTVVTTIQPSEFVQPIKDAANRVVKKRFGIFVTPKNSPVNPERFTGYHTGVDFETTNDEENIDIPVITICTGKLIYRQTVSGYGGVAVQNCTWNSSPITVLYGHLNIDSINIIAGESLDSGQQLGELGKGYSYQTAGERKHLHLSIHKGPTVNLRGYVNSQEELNNWIDPCQFFCH